MDRIATWDQACEHLAAHTTLTRDAAGGVTISVALGDKLEATLAVREVAVLGQPWLEVTGLVGAVRSLAPVSLLGANADLAVGALALAHDGSVVMRQAVPLDGLRTADLEDLVTTMAEQVARARARRV